MSRLAAAHLSQLRFGKFVHLKDGSENCLAQYNPQESVNMQSIKSRIHNMIFSRYTKDSRNVMPLRLGGINFKDFPELRPLDLILSLTAPSQISSCKLTRLAHWKFFRANLLQSSTNFSSQFTYERDFYSFEFFFIFEKYFKINDFS